MLKALYPFHQRRYWIVDQTDQSIVIPSLSTKAFLTILLFGGGGKGGVDHGGGGGGFCMAMMPLRPFSPPLELFEETENGIKLATVDAWVTHGGGATAAQPGAGGRFGGQAVLSGFPGGPGGRGGKQTKAGGGGVGSFYGAGGAGGSAHTDERGNGVYGGCGGGGLSGPGGGQYTRLSSGGAGGGGIRAGGLVIDDLPRLNQGAGGGGSSGPGGNNLEVWGGPGWPVRDPQVAIEDPLLIRMLDGQLSGAGGAGGTNVLLPSCGGEGGGGGGSAVLGQVRRSFDTYEGSLGQAGHGGYGGGGGGGLLIEQAHKIKLGYEGGAGGLGGGGGGGFYGGGGGCGGGGGAGHEKPGLGGDWFGAVFLFSSV
ncbi:MAG: hypothetical protein N0E59_02240 [Candidatus Thiodiazotropha taylori]|nr:hypothetical protein [Candidatus Thiodiazotropha taylori]